MGLIVPSLENLGQELVALERELCLLHFVVGALLRVSPEDGSDQLHRCQLFTLRFGPFLQL